MLSKLVRIYLLLQIAVQGICFRVLAQTGSADTLKLTITEAEERFLKNNLQLLAQHYNIDIANAKVITARLFPNPNFSINNGVAGTDESNPTAEQSAGLSQLIITAGKRNKNIQLAKIGAEQARYQFFDLLRTLKNT